MTSEAQSEVCEISHQPTPELEVAQILDAWEVRLYNGIVRLAPVKFLGFHTRGWARQMPIVPKFKGGAVQFQP